MQSAQAPPKDAFRVLITGFGPFSHYEVNPSWLAVKALHNTVHIAEGAPPLDTGISSTEGKAYRSIHISTLEIPMTYDAALHIVPGLHLRPPILPEMDDPAFPPPPATGYDFMFHIGVAGRGPLRMERLAHKLGYHMKDAISKLAPVVRSSPKDFSRRPDDPFVAENAERERLGMEMVEGGGDTVLRPTRGFGSAYENFPDEITTEIDVSRLVQDLKRSGIEHIYTSMDAGHYLCDFTYYCSLAEAKRTAKPYEKRRNTQVLALHCPPVNQPLTTEEVTATIKHIVVWVVGELHLLDETNESVTGR
ncbi:peptidase C15, pyroglutamyl peptidase I-like protein [Pluteus cervinus]|uniref:Peptidase C15, pyroglutamyl peptidase I-like protein n=1 Tax=Pluteus cervinus TaxID=181527 RepID=A0ACD3BB28_9AGAR|nr:peptidase C15, pyroglutamyl peptidase I-like protein [Pluteus cervinus]